MLRWRPTRCVLVLDCSCGTPVTFASVTLRLPLRAADVRSPSLFLDGTATRCVYLYSHECGAEPEPTVVGRCWADDAWCCTDHAVLTAVRLCGLAQAGLKQDPDSEELKEGRMRTIQAMTSVRAPLPFSPSTKLHMNIS